MANTEGLPDEFVASLMTTPVSASATASKAKENKKKDSSAIGGGIPDIVERAEPQKPRLSRRRRQGAPIMSAATNQRLQERMNMPMPDGGQPAAQVIRPSQSSITPSQQQNRITTSQISSSAQEEKNLMLPPSIVGEIVEHSVSSAERKSSAFKQRRKQSRFAQQAKASQSQPQILGIDGAGFPSVHMPIGTFVNKPKQPQRNQTRIEKPSSEQLRQVEEPKSEQESMKQASERDATNMLAQMSMDEIQSYQRDLEAALSPEIKEFLKARSNKKNQEVAPMKEASLEEEEESPPTTKIPIVAKKTEKDPQEEKERLAKLMSSVRTHQDLDEAYHQEMQQAHPLEHETPLGSGEGNTSDGDGSNDPFDKDFVMACDLLRSSVKRQALWAARVVSQNLSKRVQELQQETLGQSLPSHATTRKNWPLLLPISLRCLLDEPIHGQGILHTYVLQALYSLLLLNAVDDHLIWVDSSSAYGWETKETDQVGPINTGDATNPTVAELSSSPWSEKDIYQHFFMDDAVPTPPLDTAYPSNTVQPLAVDNGKSSKSVAAYSTSSSSTSAMEDAKAFEKDPMWTLLSKMRIIPRLTQLLCPKNEALMLPEEAWIASCGILAMLAQRSPGAASAIVHQQSMFERILDHCFMRYSSERQQPDHKEKAILEQVAFASMQLLSTLARQSRVTAKAIAPHMEEILPPLLLPSDNLSPLEIRLQKMGVNLWRTLLRYGLGLPGFATMLKMAAHHWALPHTNPSSLSVEYLSAFAQILECARIAQSKASDPPKAKKKPIIDEESMRILSMVPTHLAATQRRLLPSDSDVENKTSSSDLRSPDTCRGFQWNAAKLSFLSSYWSLAADNAQSTGSQEVKVEEISMEDELAFLEALDVWTDPGGEVEAAWKLVWQQESEDGGDMVIRAPKQAAASAYLSSFANILVAMDMSRGSQKNRMVQQLAKAVVKHFVERIIEGCKRTKILPRNEKVSLPRQGWMNQCYFSIAKLLFHAHTTGVLTASSDISQARIFVFSLLGHLDRGNEAVAAVLFSQDIFFMPNGSPLYDPSTGSSPISTMFLGEICGSEAARKQLDHSFKLQHGFGLTREGYGPFALDSLLTTNRVGPKTSGDLILPLGNLWLLQTLSGSIQMKHQTIDKGTNEAVRVVSTALGLLLELEEAEEIDTSCRWYSTSIPVGAKMYYLLNICLHPETILRDDLIAETACALFEKYCSQLNETSLSELSEACQSHTEPTKKEVIDPEADQNTNEKEKALLDKLLNHPDAKTIIDLSPEAMRSLEALLEDVISAYRDYGAQYSFFTKCVRLFLSPLYPPSIRCRAIQELRGMFHLLTLADESKSDEELLQVFLSGGLPGTDGSTKDASNVLDAIAVAVAKESSGRNLDGFFLQFAVATLGRNLASSILDATGSLSSSKRRLSQIPGLISSLVCDVASAIIAEKKGSKKELAAVTVKTCAARQADENFDLENRITSIRDGVKR